MELSNYEVLRLQNIEKNAEFLKNLGIDETRQTIVAQAESALPIVKKSRKKRSTAAETYDLHYDGCRKSARVRGAPASSISLGANGTDIEDPTNTSRPKPKPIRNVVEYVTIDDDEAPRDKITVISLGKFIDNCNSNHYDELSNSEISHGVMRIQSMSNHALSNRIKSIGKSPSDTSRRKMLVFYYGLQHANLLELADMAKHVLHNWYKVEGLGSTDKDVSSGSEIIESKDMCVEGCDKLTTDGIVKNGSKNIKIKGKGNQFRGEITDKPVKAAVKISSELFKLLEFPFHGVEVLTRPTILQYIWKYIKINGLQNQQDKRKIVFNEDEPLGKIFSVSKSTITMFELQQLIRDHITNQSEIV